jgi:predicted Zn-dependent peptidase
VSVRRAVPFERSEPLPGLRLVTEGMSHVRSVSVGLWVDVGSRDEPDELAGAAHLLEHLLFKGTATRSARDIAEAFDSVGGDVNAYTSREHTCYYARVLDTDLPMATEILFDMFRSAALREDDLEAERKVVLEEIGMSLDAPEDWVHDLFGESALPGHALRRPVIGYASTVGAMDRSRMADFYGTYLPGRLVVSAAGNLEHDQLAADIVRVFGRGGPPFRRTVGEPPRTARAASYEQRTTEQVHLVWGGESLPRDDPDRYALSVLNALYGGGMSSRLFQGIRETRGLAYSIYSGYSMYIDGGLFSVYAGTGESTAAQVLDIVRGEASELCSGGITEAEVERAKGHVKGGLVLSMDDPGGRMFRLGRTELVHGDIETVDELLARVDAVTASDVTRVAGRLFGGTGFVLASVGPTAPGTLDRYVEPL